MIRINLLPHRAAARKLQQLQFYALLGVSGAIGLVAWGLVHLFIAERIDHQASRNDYLRKENARLDTEIAEIKKLKEEISALLARKQVIESLQANRAQSVQLLDELAKQTPDGVYLKALKQDGQRVSLAGYAQSNARVSTLMRNIQASPHLENPQLVEIKAAQVSNRRLSEFSLGFAVKRPAIEEPKGAGSGKSDGKAAPAAKRQG